MSGDESSTTEEILASDDMSGFEICSIPTKFSKNWATELSEGLKINFLKLHESNADIKKTVRADIKKFNDDLQLKVKSMEASVDANTQSCLENTGAINELRQEMSKLSARCNNLQHENNELKKQINQVDTYTRRDNLVFHGIRETPSESNSQCILALRKFFRDILHIGEADEIVFVRCHRLKGSSYMSTRPIIARFREFCDREKVWSCLSKLPKPSQYHIRENFPDNIAYNRRKILPIFAKARQTLNLPKHQITLKGDVLTIEKQQYTVNNIGSLKGELHPKVFSEKCGNNVHLFGGIYSAYNVLSNYGKFSFAHDDHVFPSVEHGFVYYKCLEAGNMSAAQRVLEVPEPYMVKEIGRGLKRLNVTQWDQKKDAIMVNLLKSKFKAGSSFADDLLGTGNNTLGEAGLDAVYGTGIPITRKNALNKNEWSGSNKLGTMLMDIRTSLQ